MTQYEIEQLHEELWFYSEAHRGKGWPLWPGEINIYWSDNRGFLAFAQLVALSEDVYRG